MNTLGTHRGFTECLKVKCLFKDFNNLKTITKRLLEREPKETTVSSVVAQNDTHGSNLPQWFKASTIFSQWKN